MNTQIEPFAPTLATNSFGTTSPGPKFRLDATGTGDPHGDTVTNPASNGSTTVTFTTTAAAPTGTPPRPATTNSNTEPAPRRPPPANNPSTVEFADRVSNNRAGLNGIAIWGTAAPPTAV